MDQSAPTTVHTYTANMTEIEVQAGVRWDQQNNINENEDEAFEEGNPAKLFERSRIKALAGQ